jgi:8-oxo-dGTP diphosphatase
MDANIIKRHFTATGIVFSPQKEILMIKHKKLQVWLPPGGHVEKDELPEDAVLREIYEETGIIAKIYSMKQKLSLSSKHCKELERPFVILLEDMECNGLHVHIDMFFLCIALNKELVLQQSEISDIGWFTIEQFMTLKTFNSVVQTVLNAFDYIENQDDAS